MSNLGQEAVAWSLPGSLPQQGFVRLSYRWEPEKPCQSLPVVALHGSFMHKEWFIPLEGQLPGCRLLSVDLPGHGLSERSTNEALDLHSMASAICSLARRLGIFDGPYALVGHSLGGAVALLVAHLAPSAPLWFVALEGNMTSADCPEVGLARKFAKMSTPPSAAEVLQVMKPLDTVPSSQGCQDGIWTTSASVIGESLGLLAQKLLASLVRWCDSGELLEIYLGLPAVRHIYGENSGKYHESLRAAIARHKNARASGIKDSGHFMLSEKPGETVSAIQDLIAGAFACLEPDDSLQKRRIATDNIHQQAKRRRKNAIQTAKLPAGGVGDMKGGSILGFMAAFESRPYLEMETLLQLQKWNTPTIWNGWEQITKYNFGEECFNLEPITDYMPQMGPMVGYAVTVQINPGNPAVPREFGAGRQGFRDHVASLPAGVPKIIVVQDLDKPKLLGSMWGEVNANFFRSLGCIGCICDGAVRDLDEMTTAGFHAISRGTCIGHAHGGIPLRWNLSVEVFGVTVRPGQLIHADKHGFLAVPEEDEKELLQASEFMDMLERRHTIRVGKEACSMSNKTGMQISAEMQRAMQMFGREKVEKFAAPDGTGAASKVI